MTDGLVEIYPARDLVHAYMLKAVLEEAGIPVQVGNEALQSSIGELPPGLETAPRILVLESDAERAILILKEIEDKQGGGSG